MPNMKSGNGNNNSRTNTNGGEKEKGKGKNAVYSQANEPTSGVRKVGKQDKDSEIN